VVKKKILRKRGIKLAEFVCVHTVEFDGYEVSKIYPLHTTTTLALIILLQLLYVRL
jgi:hypothetical protein